jgi:outer membrane murein-binding lipoprotein Lpp
MKSLLFKSLLFITILGAIASCGSSKNASEMSRKKQELKEKQDKLDQDKKRFEMLNNKDLK